MLQIIEYLVHITAAGKVDAPQPEYSLGSYSTRQRNAIQMAFRWRVDSGPLNMLNGRP